MRSSEGPKDPTRNVLSLLANCSQLHFGRVNNFEYTILFNQEYILHPLGLGPVGAQSVPTNYQPSDFFVWFETSEKPGVYVLVLVSPIQQVDS